MTIMAKRREAEAENVDGIEEEPLEVVIERSLNASVNLICAVNGENNAMTLLLKVNGRIGRFLLDTGSATSLVNRKWIERMNLDVKNVTCPKAVSVTGEVLKLYGGHGRGDWQACIIAKFPNRGLLLTRWYYWHGLHTSLGTDGARCGHKADENW